MFLLNKPNDKLIADFLKRQQNANFSYAETGASRAANAPPGYNIDHNRILLGTGENIFEKAIEAINNWKMFEISWLRVFPAEPLVETGQIVVIAVQHFGFWSLNANRIVYTFGEKGDVEKYGFAYGTLQEHAEQGEERFSVEIDRATGQVWYDLFAFSKPNDIFAKIGYPLTRYLQKRFAGESKDAMFRAVN